MLSLQPIFFQFETSVRRDNRISLEQKKKRRKGKRDKNEDIEQFHRYLFIDNFPYRDEIFTREIHVVIIE